MTTAIQDRIVSKSADRLLTFGEIAPSISQPPPRRLLLAKKKKLGQFYCSSFRVGHAHPVDPFYSTFSRTAPREVETEGKRKPFPVYGLVTVRSMTACRPPPPLLRAASSTAKSVLPSLSRRTGREWAERGPGEGECHPLSGPPKKEGSRSRVLP